VQAFHLKGAPTRQSCAPSPLCNKIGGITAENVEASQEFLTYLTQLKNLENLCRQEKLVAYYLLDTDEEKFALFFERSNSKGIQLNFIDILAQNSMQDST
jgi:uncharacterized protein with ParB-like and HNH nuclease domain